MHLVWLEMRGGNLPEHVCYWWESFVWTREEAEVFVVKVTGELECQVEEKDRNPLFCSRKVSLEDMVTG